MSELQEINLRTWMTNLPYSLKNIPFIHLAIPGSHDSMTYGITHQSGVAPDAPTAVRRLMPLFRGTIIRWSKTQLANAKEQLEAGIRYLDLRFATMEGVHGLYFTHGLYADEITEPLNQVKEFLDANPNEVVILDCQHFYRFQMEDHRRLFSILINTFGLRICPPQGDLESITLGTLNKKRQQVIIIYRNQVVTSSGRFWRNGQFPTPWPEKDNITGLLQFLRTSSRSPSAGYVTQAVITPSPTFIVFRWRSNIKDSCAVPVAKSVLPWVTSLMPGAPPPVPNDSQQMRINVVITDFININDNHFCKVIVGLNYKLLEVKQ